MSTYLTYQDAVSILRNMQIFESDLNRFYQDRGYDLRANTGRRNILVSTSQEVETARVLSTKFDNVIADGAPGKPDIFIGSLQRELECKLTSGSFSNNYVSFSFSTDWGTICQKGTLDYVYILTDKDFQNFAFLFFEGLTSDDFFPPASGSRGKSRMNKEKGMKKCVPLYGGFYNKNNQIIEKLQNSLKLENQKYNDRIAELGKRPQNTLIQRRNVQNLVQNSRLRFEKKKAKIKEKIEFWKKTSDRFTFILDSIS